MTLRHSAQPGPLLSSRLRGPRFQPVTLAALAVQVQASPELGEQRPQASTDVPLLQAVEL